MKICKFYAAPEVPRLGDLGGFQCKKPHPQPLNEGEGSLATEIRIVTQVKMKICKFYAAPEVPRLGDLGGCQCTSLIPNPSPREKGVWRLELESLLN